MWPLLLWTFAPVGWRTNQTVAGALTRTYSVDASFCPGVLPGVYEDAFLTWRLIGCADLRTEVRRAFDAWSHNSYATFVEVAAGGDVTVRAGTLANADFVAQADTTQVVVHNDTCWYRDRGFCRAVQPHLSLLWIVGVVGWTVTAAVGVVILCVPTRSIDSITRVVNWALFVSVPLVLFGVLYPCGRCYDLRRTLVHEVGHVLGFGHSDEGAQRCGCGNATVSCGVATSDDGVMRSATRRDMPACLSRDDVDGVRSLYGGRCDDPVWCHDGSSLSGTSRIAVALVYGFVVAWVVVVLRNTIHYRAPRLLRHSAPPALPRHAPAVATPPARPALPTRASLTLRR